MKYSFVLIAFNEANTVTACIKSISRLKDLGSSYEILVMDDGSTDETAQSVTKLAQKDSHIRLLGDGKNHGRGYGRYMGVNASKGEFIAMIDADIVVPANWLRQVLAGIDGHDVAGGIAVPDGDVAYVYRRFKLQPKTVMGSTTITGNNGLYRRRVFAKLNFDTKLREGEDVDFNHRSAAAGFSSFCVPGLTVEHQEHKSFPRSMLWLYQSGVGATRQLIRFKEIRLPDLAFAATLLSLIGAIILHAVALPWLPFLVPLLCLLAASLMHMRGKFHLPFNRPLPVISAILTDAVLIACYYVGRVAGFVVLAIKAIKNSS